MNIKKSRLLAFLSLLFVTPLGFFSKFYGGIAHDWVNNYSGDILYEIFWCLFIFILIPRKKALGQIPIWVFCITCFLEFLQSWQTPILQTARSSLIGKFLLGTTFSWWDFPYYLIGCFIGWLWLRQIWQFQKQ